MIHDNNRVDEPAITYAHVVDHFLRHQAVDPVMLSGMLVSLLIEHDLLDKRLPRAEFTMAELGRVLRLAQEQHTRAAVDPTPSTPEAT